MTGANKEIYNEKIYKRALSVHNYVFSATLIQSYFIHIYLHIHIFMYVCMYIRVNVESWKTSAILSFLNETWKSTFFSRGRNSTHWFFTNPPKSSAHASGAWRHLHTLVLITIWDFYFDISEWHILSARGREHQR